MGSRDSVSGKFEEETREKLAMLLGRLKSLLMCWLIYTTTAVSRECMTTGRMIAIFQESDYVYLVFSCALTAMNRPFPKPQD
jgi:hypothetical protein